MTLVNTAAVDPPFAAVATISAHDPNGDMTRIWEEVRNRVQRRYNTTLQSADFDDIAQASVLAAWEKKFGRGVDSVGRSDEHVGFESFIRYATGCAKHLAYQRWQETVKVESLPNPDEVKAPRTCMESPLEANEENLAISTALKNLPDDDRDMLIAHAVDGVTFNELAEKFGVSVSTCQRRLRRAAQALRRRLGPVLGRDSCERRGLHE
jgi:RNA polymerase sigma factor (sigma-70 family)